MLNALVDAAYNAFSGFERPTHFIDYLCCPECAEHDEALRGCGRREIGPSQMGTPGWSPVPFLTPEAYGYVMPRLLEMALTGERNKDGDLFVFQYLLALSPKPEHRNLDYFTFEQATVLLRSLQYIRRDMSAEAEAECCEGELTMAMELWDSKVRTYEART